MKATREQFTVPNAPEQRHPETGLAPLFVNDGELVLTSLEGEVAQEIKIHDQQNGVLALVGSSPQGDFKATRLFGSMLSRSLGDELTHALENISQSRATPRALPALLEQHVKNALMVARARADDLFEAHGLHVPITAVRVFEPAPGLQAAAFINTGENHLYLFRDQALEPMKHTNSSKAVEVMALQPQDRLLILDKTIVDQLPVKQICEMLGLVPGSRQAERVIQRVAHVLTTEAASKQHTAHTFSALVFEPTRSDASKITQEKQPGSRKEVMDRLATLSDGLQRLDETIEAHLASSVKTVDEVSSQLARSQQTLFAFLRLKRFLLQAAIAETQLMLLRTDLAPRYEAGNSLLFEGLRYRVTAFDSNKDSYVLQPPRHAIHPTTGRPLTFEVSQKIIPRFSLETAQAAPSLPLHHGDRFSLAFQTEPARDWIVEVPELALNGDVLLSDAEGMRHVSVPADTVRQQIAKKLSTSIDLITAFHVNERQANKLRKVERQETIS